RSSTEQARNTSDINRTSSLRLRVASIWSRLVARAENFICCWSDGRSRRATHSSRDLEAGRKARLPQNDVISAHWNALLEEEVALSLSHREGAVGMDHTMPRKAFASGGENVADKTRCFRVDVAVGSDKPNGNRADTAQDQFCAWIESVAVHPVASLPRHIWSGRRDLNPRPPGPQPGALPSYATPRRGCKSYRREPIAAVPHFRAPYAANPRCVEAKPDSRSTPAKGDSMTP